MRSGQTQDQINNRITRQYVAWASGNGATVEFPIGKTITRVDDLIVTVAGLTKRPADATAAHDYSVRGLTNGYPGDRNTVKFAVAPGAGADIGFIVHAT